MPDLRRRMERILRDYGHNIYLQRRTGDSSVTGEASYANGFERHTVRNMIPSSVGMARAAQEAMEGRIVDVDVVYYFQWDANPLEGDRIHEVDPRGHLVFDIDYSYPHRGNGGRIEYWACGATKTSEIGEER